MVRGIAYMGLRRVSGHPLCSFARPCAAFVSHVWRPLRSNGRSEFACLAIISHSPFCKRIAPLLASYHSVLVLFLTSLTSTLLVMRVYALYFRNRWILFIVTLESIAGFVLACWTLTKSLPGAAATVADAERGARLQGVAFSGLLVVDFTVFVLTMARSIKLWTHKEPFLKLLFIDGLLYYSVIWNLNLVNVIVLLVTHPVLDLSTPIFTNVLSVVMITRLMINLRDPTIHSSADRDGTVTTSHVGYVSTLVLDETYSSSMLAVQTKSIPSPYTA